MIIMVLAFVTNRPHMSLPRGGLFYKSIYATLPLNRGNALNPSALQQGMWIFLKPYNSGVQIWISPTTAYLRIIPTIFQSHLLSLEPTDVIKH